MIIIHFDSIVKGKCFFFFQRKKRKKNVYGILYYNYLKNLCDNLHFMRISAI
jgi:hypothetical protein